MKKFLFFIAMAFSLTACNSNSEPTIEQADFIEGQIDFAVSLDSMIQNGPDSYTAIPTSETNKECIQAANTFAFKLLDIISKTQDSDNVIVSPLSVYTTLSMIANGDNTGEVRDEILTLCAPTKGKEGLSQINAFNTLLFEYLPRLDNQTVCNFANAVMHAPSFDICMDFLSTMSNSYNAEDIPQSPAGHDGMRIINQWVSNRTNEIIPNFLRSPMQTEIAIVNAAYFKGAWAFPFVEKDNTEDKFKNYDASTSTVSFMHQCNLVKYSESETAQYVEINYGYGNYKFCIVLPTSYNDGQLTELSVDEFQTLEKFATVETINLSLPKFDLYCDLNIDNLFTELGLTKIVTKGLDGIVKNMPIPLNKFLHSAAISVNEKGAETGAATYAGWFISSGYELEPTIIEITLNRPFYFFITEDSTGAIMYMGAVNKL